MANTSNGSQKWLLAQATQGENETPVQDNVRRQQLPTVRQQQMSKKSSREFIRRHTLMTNLR